MKPTEIKAAHTAYSGNSSGAAATVHSTWKRVLLLIVLAYEGAGGILGGVMLTRLPDGRLMQMPVEIMHGVFTDFWVPGILLLGLGVLNLIAFMVVLERRRAGWFWAGLAVGGYLVWFIVEIVILQELHWLHAMWGLPVLAAGWAALPMIPKEQEVLRKCLLACGILSSVWYAGLNVFVPAQWEAYNSASQTVSELSAVDAPTRQLWVLWSLPYTLFSLAFSWGVWRSAGSSRLLRVTGALLLVYSTLGILWPFAPMHLREVLAAGGGTLSDTLHVTLGAVTEVLFFLALGFSAGALGRGFRIYAVATFLCLLIFGVLTFLDAPGVSANAPTPFMGVWERINIGVFLLWVVVLALKLWRFDRNGPSNAQK